MKLFFYRYFPRFMTGACALRKRNGRIHYTLLTGPVVVTPKSDFVIAKVDFFNCFGHVWFPKLLDIYRPQ